MEGGSARKISTTERRIPHAHHESTPATLISGHGHDRWGDEVHEEESREENARGVLGEGQDSEDLSSGGDVEFRHGGPLGVILGLGLGRRRGGHGGLGGGRLALRKRSFLWPICLELLLRA
jgi:hypothetical protein